MEKSERFRLFIRALKSAPRASSTAEALELIRSTLNRIEDEHSGTSFAPERWRDDGRLYPPEEDAARPIGNSLIEYRSFAHSTYIGANGAFEIVRRKDQHTEISKAGKDAMRIKRPGI
jgi:hypothetical protein